MSEDTETVTYERIWQMPVAVWRSPTDYTLVLWRIGISIDRTLEYWFWLPRFRVVSGRTAQFGWGPFGLAFVFGKRRRIGFTVEGEFSAERG